MPDRTKLKLLGYADDTNILINSEESLIEVNNIISQFEQATGARLNRNSKTKIFGLGTWCNKTQWSLVWLKVELQYFSTLGVYYSNNYTDALDKNWSTCINSIRLHINMLSNRRLTLFQRVTYANSCILSKIWYITHIYPLTKNAAKVIDQTLLNYIWKGRYRPIRRSTVIRPRGEGGLGIIDCFIKSRVILLKSFLRCHISEEYSNPLMLYYIYTRLHNILPMEYSVHNASVSTTPYYEIIYGLIKDILHRSGCPLISNKKLYRFMLPYETSHAETYYPTFNWKRIWSSFSNTIFNSNDKEIIFKHLHMCLATNQRLAMMNQNASSTCPHCPDDRDQTPLHMFYLCTSIKPLFLWLLRVLLKLNNFKPTSNIRFIYFDNVYRNDHQKIYM